MGSVTDGTPATAGASRAVGHSYFITEPHSVRGFMVRASASIGRSPRNKALHGCLTPPQSLTEDAAGVMRDSAGHKGHEWVPVRTSRLQIHKRSFVPAALPRRPCRLDFAEQHPLPTGEFLEATVLPTPQKPRLPPNTRPVVQGLRAPQAFNNLPCSPHGFGVVPVIYRISRRNLKT